MATMQILITTGDLRIPAELGDTPTGKAIAAALPLEGTANLWGDEIYFEIPLNIDPEADAREVVEMGDLGYWPMGPAFCIFFGPTPVSTGDAPRAYSPVNVFGRVLGDAAAFKTVASGATIRVEWAVDPLQ